MENFHSEEMPVSSENPQPQPFGWLRFLIEALQTIILAVVLYFLIDAVVDRVRVENISMEPTLQPGEFLLVNKVTFLINDVNRGDVVVFHYPQNPQEKYIKRVLGLPGDVVEVRDGQVFVNESLLDEPYIADAPQYNGRWEVPDKMYFMLGDNRNQSSDSHSWGFVPKANLVGRADFIYWPLSQLRTLKQSIIVNASSGIK